MEAGATVTNNIPGLADFSDAARKAGLSGAAKKPLFPAQKPGKEALTFGDFSINNDLAALKRNLAMENFVLQKIALEGQITVVYGAPNAGKTLLTLRMLCDAVEAGRIQGQDVYYLNLDDNLAGAVEKTELVSPLGIKMLCPHLQPDKDFKFEDLVAQAVKDKQGKGKTLIIDTAKKVCDIMDKFRQSELFQALRKLCGQGWTIILLSHTNKNKRDGKLVYSGTADILQDVDTAWMLGSDPTPEGILCQFENFKSRGSNTEPVHFFSPIETHDSYTERFQGLRMVTGEELTDLQHRAQVKACIEEQHELVMWLRELLAGGGKTRGQIEEAFKRSDIRFSIGVSRRALSKVLAQLAGHIWSVEKSGTAHHYYLKDGQRMGGA